MNTPLTIAPALAALPPILPEGVEGPIDEQKHAEFMKVMVRNDVYTSDSTGPLFLENPTPHNDDIAAKPVPRRSQRASYIRRKGRK